MAIFNFDKMSFSDFVNHIAKAYGKNYVLNFTAKRLVDLFNHRRDATYLWENADEIFSVFYSV